MVSSTVGSVTSTGWKRRSSYVGFTQSHCYFPWRNTKGKTSGRGDKGTKKRYQVRPGFEGGQLPLYILTGVITSLVYLSITFALSTSFMHIGSFLASH